MEGGLLTTHTLRGVDDSPRHRYAGPLRLRRKEGEGFFSPRVIARYEAIPDKQVRSV